MALGHPSQWRFCGDSLECSAYAHGCVPCRLCVACCRKRCRLSLELGQAASTSSKTSMRRSKSTAAAMPSPLRWYVLATSVVGVPVVAGAAAAAALSHPSPRSMLGIAMFFCFAILAESRPVPIDPAGRRLVSLAFVFIIASQILFGWEWAILTGAAAIGVCMAFSRAEPLKVFFNSATYAIATGLAAFPQVVTGHVDETATQASPARSSRAARSSSSSTSCSSAPRSVSRPAARSSGSSRITFVTRGRSSRS